MKTALPIIPMHVLGTSEQEAALDQRIREDNAKHEEIRLRLAKRWAKAKPKAKP